MTRMQQFQSVIDAWKRKDIEAVLGAMSMPHVKVLGEVELPAAWTRSETKRGYPLDAQDPEGGLE